MPELVAFEGHDFLHLDVLRLLLLSRLTHCLEVLDILNEVSKPVSEQSPGHGIQAFLSVDLSYDAFKARIVDSLLLVELMVIALVKDRRFLHVRLYMFA
jgi:hypothetical protein